MEFITSPLAISVLTLIGTMLLLWLVIFLEKKGVIVFGLRTLLQNAVIESIKDIVDELRKNQIDETERIKSEIDKSNKAQAEDIKAVIKETAAAKSPGRPKKKTTKG